MSRSAGPAGQDTDWPPGADQSAEEPAQAQARESGGRGRWLGHPLALVVAGAVALVAGAGIALAAVRVMDPPPAGGTVPAGTVPAGSAPSPSSRSGTSGNSASGHGAAGQGASPAALPPLGGSGGRPMRQLMIMGRVTAVGRTSITLSARGRRITATITRSTRITGRGRRVAAIKIGDTVSAQINATGSPTVIAIQDPVSIP
ncbi:MAG: hypothetical protein JWL68_2025 [Actinomycetia bacterium]|nr:hypothetical protein [Actinomycetes bacterium]